MAGRRALRGVEENGERREGARVDAVVLGADAMSGGEGGDERNLLLLVEGAECRHSSATSSLVFFPSSL